MVNIKFNNNKQEFTEAVNYYYSKTKKRNFDIVLGLLISVLSIILYILLDHSYAYVFSFVAGAFLLSFSIFKGTIISSLRFMSDKKFNEEYNMSFDDNGIHFVTDSVKSDIVWNYYNKVWETKKFFYLFYGKELFTLIPKRAIINHDELIELRYLIQKYIKDYTEFQ